MSANTTHEVFPQPTTASVSVWRYIGLSKYLDLITSGTLFLARADLLGDKHEGSTTRVNLEVARLTLGAHMPELEVTEVLNGLGKFRVAMKGQIFVNCWHMSDFESEAMWKLYGRSGDAIAIRTRYSSLVSSLPENVFVGAVNYIDYNRDIIPDGNALASFMYKRRSFEHEKEVRILAWIPDQTGVPVQFEIEEFGIRIAVDLRQMIEEIYVAPECPDWQYRLVAKISEEFLPLVPVKRSSLADPAIF